MKKIFTLFTVLGIYSMAHAQTKGQNEFGFNLGINSAYVTSSQQYGAGTGLIWNFSAALSAEHYLSDVVGLKLRAIYDPKGWGDAIYADGTKQVTGVYYTLNYVTIPLTLNAHFGKEKNWYLGAGPYVGFLLNATDSYTNSDLKSSFNSTDFGIDANIGFKIPITDKLKAFFEFDQQIGASNILVKGSDSANLERANFTVGLKF
ncbi:MAG: hypothetical protein JWQ34_1268 [Mucilaginibacter sp.]|uniref:outer membrane beta-barrel protein n=1 Tax=Mucilaginibacter sp. TaxID=1882438 RepID=UPI0026237354|nr:outer membrane beta-barrel protein [Mucilaginibacter sp.]MDB5003043.1 hypothetical protein [Mucilaginibacter sp.]